MNSNQKIINLLTICRRANKLVFGFDAVKDSVRDKTACCVITAEDISPKTLKEIKFFCESSGIPVICRGFISEQLMYAVGKKSVVAGVCDQGFAGRFIELSQQSGE
jgi:ribosomal protein L7Ae-like RNA K-turn-binding protein